MQKISVYQIGSRMHYAVPNMLNDMGMLDFLYTDIVGGKGIVKVLNFAPNKVLPTGVVKLKNRKPKVPNSRIKHFPLFGVKIGQKLKNANSLEENLQVFLSYNKEFADRIIDKGIPNSDAVYGFNTASLELFKAHGNNTYKILEQTIAPFLIEKEILEGEVDLYKDWIKGEFSYDSSAAKEFAQREVEEISLADSIICASQFVADGIKKIGGDKNKINVVPYGVNLSFFREKNRQREIKNRKIKVLTVGRIGLRKGIQYIYKAAKELKDVAEFTVVGPIEISNKAIKKISKYVKVVPSVSKHELLDYYNAVDVFLLPSLCEGSATVVYEALASGLPVVTTHNSGTLIQHEEDGLIVPIKDHEAIVAAILRYRDGDFFMNSIELARKRAKDASFEAYQKRVLSYLESLNGK